VLPVVCKRSSQARIIDGGAYIIAQRTKGRALLLLSLHGFLVIPGGSV
jgi:hypothetical protein